MTRSGRLQNGVMALVLVALVAACGQREPDQRPISSFTAREIFDRAEFELEQNDDPDEAPLRPPGGDGNASFGSLSSGGTY